jgi:hypothetical protein
VLVQFVQVRIGSDSVPEIVVALHTVTAPTAQLVLPTGGAPLSSVLSIGLAIVPSIKSAQLLATKTPSTLR